MTSTFAGGVAGALTDYFRTQGQTSFQDALFNGAIGAAIVFILYGCVHLARSVWLEHKSETGGTVMQGVGGSLTVLIIIAAFGAGGVLAYRNAESIIVLRTPPPDATQMKALTDCQTALSTFNKPEPPSSLRRRTIRLADQVWHYLDGRLQDRGAHVPPGTGINWTAYDGDTLTYYKDHYEKQVIAIIEEYKAKGVEVGSLENDASNNMWQLLPMLFTPQRPARAPLCEYALCDFRELAYHVDANDQRVDVIP